MNDRDANLREEVAEALRPVERGLRRLTVVVALLTLVVLLDASAVFGYLVNFFAGDPLLYGGAAMGAALLGFCFGWFARGGKK